MKRKKVKSGYGLLHKVEHMNIFYNPTEEDKVSAIKELIRICTGKTLQAKAPSKEEA